MAIPEAEKKEFVKTPKQIEATKIHAEKMHTMLLGGSRSGKTLISVRNIVARAGRKKSRHLIGKTFFNQVKTSIGMDTLPKVMELCFPETKYTLNKSDWFMTLPNGSEVWLTGFDTAERVEKILGKEYSTIYFNEATDIQEDTVETLLTRLAENSGLELKAYYDCNPKSRKHWTYTKFFKGQSQDGTPISDFHDYGYLRMNPQDNISNLNPKYIKMLEGMTLKKRIRFLEGEFQDDIEGALWNALMIEKAKNKKVKEIKKTVIAIDPAITNNENSDLTGIIACGIDIENEGVVIADYSGKFTPNDWAQRAVNAYRKHEAAYIVVEVNQGGDMVETMIKNIDRKIKVVKVRASKGKFARAEPVAALYERGEVRHCEGLDELESEMCEYVPMNSKKSPDRLDALVWGLTDLMLQPKNKIIIPRGY